MHGDNLIGTERVLISQLLSEKDTDRNEFAVKHNYQETHVDRYRYIKNDTSIRPLSHHGMSTRV